MISSRATGAIQQPSRLPSLIAIGLIVLSCAALAALHHPYWIGLADLMGAGLIFSGITEFCGLAPILNPRPNALESSRNGVV